MRPITGKWALNIKGRLQFDFYANLGRFWVSLYVCWLQGMWWDDLFTFNILCCCCYCVMAWKQRKQQHKQTATMFQNFSHRNQIFWSLWETFMMLAFVVDVVVVQAWMRNVCIYFCITATLNDLLSSVGRWWKIEKCIIMLLRDNCKIRGLKNVMKGWWWWYSSG